MRQKSLHFPLLYGCDRWNGWVISKQSVCTESDDFAVSRVSDGGNLPVDSSKFVDVDASFGVVAVGFNSYCELVVFGNLLAWIECLQLVNSGIVASADFLFFVVEHEFPKYEYVFSLFHICKCSFCYLSLQKYNKLWLHTNYMTEMYYLCDKSKRTNR